MRSKMWRVLHNLYEGVQSRIRINDADTDWFELAEGLRQGCVLSPLLYAIFINSLADALKQAASEHQVEGVRLSADDQLLLLLYADDIVLLAESLEDLQRMSDILARHARQWRYEVNLRKTKYMCFSQPVHMPVPAASAAAAPGPAPTPSLVWDGKDAIERVSMYKYLGIHLSDTLDWNKHKQHVLQRTTEAADSARRSSIDHMQPRQASYIWNALARTCAEFAVERRGVVRP